MSTASLVATSAGDTRVRGHRANDRLALALVAIVALAPTPFGSARPFFWSLWALVFALLGFAYFGVFHRRSLTFRLPPFAWVSALAYFCLCGFLVVQMLPIGGLPQFEPIVTRQGEVVRSITLSLDPALTWLMLLRFLTYGICALLFWQVAVSRERARRLLEILFFIIAGYAFYALLALTQFGDPILLFQKWAYQGVATATFVNRNSFATFLAFGMVAGVGLIVFDFSARLVDADEARRFRGLSRRMGFHFAGLAVIVAALLATQSRMGLFSGGLGAAVTFLISIARLPRGARLAGRIAVFFTFALAILLLLYGSGVADRLGSVESAADVRGSLYTQIWTMILARPWLGYGGGTFEVAYPLYHILPVSPDLVWDKAHDSYLALWTELGLVVGSIPLALIGMSFLRAIRNWRRDSSWVTPAVAVGVVVTAAVHSIVDFSLEIEAVTFMFIALLAIGSADAERGYRLSR